MNSAPRVALPPPVMVPPDVRSPTPPPAAPVTAKLPVRLLTLMPLVDELTVMEPKVNVPELPAPVMLTAVPVVGVAFTSLTATLVTLAPLRPVLPLVERLRPRTLLLEPSVTVPCTVGLVPAIDGRLIVPAGGVIPKTASKVVKLAL